LCDSFAIRLLESKNIENLQQELAEVEEEMKEEVSKFELDLKQRRRVEDAPVDDEEITYEARNPTNATPNSKNNNQSKSSSSTPRKVTRKRKSRK